MRAECPQCRKSYDVTELFSCEKVVYCDICRTFFDIESNISPDYSYILPEQKETFVVEWQI